MTAAGAPTAAYDGVASSALAARLGVPRVVAFDRVASTMDVAHALAAGGADAGTLVLADAQTGGRGRAGRRWASPAGAGVWLTLIERPRDASVVDVLALRVGLRAALAVQPFADAAVHIKWPNDLLLAGRKLAGVLVEARWRDARPEWVAIGFGLNVRPPAELPNAAGLRDHVARVDVLEALVPALRDAAAARGPLTSDELRTFAARDTVRGRRITAPVAGTVREVLASGELLVDGQDGEPVRVRQATLIFAD